MNDFNDGIKHTVIKFTDNIRLAGCIGTLEDRIKIQNLSKQTEDTNKIQFRENKCNILYLHRNHQLYTYNAEYLITQLIQK